MSNLTAAQKVESHLPGHQNQDKNMNGVPDRMEGRNQDLNRDGVPDRLQGGQIGTGLNQDLNRDGIPDRLQGGQMGINGQPLQGQGFGLNQDLNRNGIPDRLEGGQMGINGQPIQGQGFGFIGSTQTTTTSVVQVREAPVVVEQIQKAAVVHEIIKTEEVVQVQPIIERQREKLDVYEVVQPMREREVIATEVRQGVLPTQTRATIVEDNSAFLAQRSAPTDFSTREVAATMSQTVQNAPIIHETITHRVIEEVQPVIYKEIDRPILIKETLPIYEKIVEAPHAHRTVLPMQDMGTRVVTSSVTTTGFTDLNRDGIPDQLQGGQFATGQGMTYQTTGLQSGIQSQGTFMPAQGLTTGDKIASHLPGHQFQDRNGNGIPDRMEGRNQDLNRDGVPDRLQGGQMGINGQPIQGQGFGLNQDLNRNGIPDSLERNQGLGQQGLMGQQGLVGGVNDRNGNGIPDNLERHGQRSLGDLNGNGIPDRMEKGHGLNDMNGNGIPDSLERKMGSTSINSTRL